MKQAGVLCPVSALPGRFGVGDFGRAAYQFVDKLADCKIKIWQILPLNPLAFGNSPYQPYSSFAGDELYLDLYQMVEDQLLNAREVTCFNNHMNSVEYEDVREKKDALFHKAFENFVVTDDFNDFVAKNDWLEGYALYRVFKNHNEGKDWVHWSKEYKEYLIHPTFPNTIFAKEILYQEFLQYYFFKQWHALKKYANDKGIIIIGDMPIYVGLDSSDCWLNQESFLLEEDGTPSFVAGVPPDYFSQYGQRWGNPIYNWDYLKDHDFDFWIRRMHAACEMYDILRIDHFRGFDTFWKIPAEEPTAVIGEWVEAPGYDLFDTFFEKYPDAHILAEDLGELREEVYDLRDHYHFKGMFIYMFHRNDLENFDLDKVIVYTGTHDNDTLDHWYETLSKKDKKQLDEDLEEYKERLINRKIIHYCMDMDVETVIVPVWDIMGLPGECRFNTPGTTDRSNWRWKMKNFTELNKSLEFLEKVVVETGRD